MNNVEIYKEGFEVLQTELNIISSMTHINHRYNDTANEIIAFDLDCDRNTAEDIVDVLNDNNEYGLWYLGAEDEEYVYVN